MQAEATPTPTVEMTEEEPPDPVSALHKFFGDDFTTVLIVLAFIIVFIAQTIVTFKRKWDAYAVKIFCVTVIAFFGVFAASTVDSKDNAAAVFALLGTIAGYILGKSDEKFHTNGREETSTQDKVPPPLELTDSRKDKRE
jgi:hypothetical protein